MVSEIFKTIPISPSWHLIEKIRIQFDTYHPQGIVKVGEGFYLSTVEILKKTKKIRSKNAPYDRTAGEGIGYLVEFDRKGNFVKKIILGEGSIYHPGGIDYNGKWIWVPVAEYRPKSASIIYKVDPTNWEAREVFRVSDHIGGVVYNQESHTLIGLNWDAKIFYEWTLNGNIIRKTPNKYQEIAYQDCKYVSPQNMICSGVHDKRGGIDLLNMNDFKRIYGIEQVPLTPKKVSLTRNPMTVEKIDSRLRYYFLPENRRSTLYVYEVY